MLQLSSTVYSGGLGSLSGVHRATLWIVSVDLRLSFRLSQIGCFILQQPQMLPLCPILLPLCGYLTTASACQSPECRSSPAHSLFFPSFILWVLHGPVYSFPMINDSCQLSAGALWDLLDLSVYFWCICGKRCTVCPCILLTSCPSSTSNSWLWLLDPEWYAVHYSVWPHDYTSNRILNAMESFIQHHSSDGLLCLSLNRSALLPAPIFSGSLKG